MMPHAKANDGFTLVELLVSLALLSLMAIYAIQAFSTLRNMNRVEADVAAQMEVDAVAKHLRGELGQISAEFLPDATFALKLLFTGKSSTLTYVAKSNGEREVGGLYLVTLALEKEGTLWSRRQLIQSKISEHANEVVLLRNVKTIQFTFYDNSIPRQPLTDWIADNQLPMAIQINVIFADKDKRNWPQTLVRLQNVE
jgi:general secretion pathway protein J